MLHPSTHLDQSIPSSSRPPNKYAHGTYTEITSEYVISPPPPTRTHTAMAKVSSATIANHQICTTFTNNYSNYNPMYLK